MDTIMASMDFWGKPLTFRADGTYKAKLAVNGLRRWIAPVVSVGVGAILAGVDFPVGMRIW